MQKIKKGDNVKVIKGKDIDKTGTVLAVIKKDVRGKRTVRKVVVQGVNMMKRHQKPNPVLNLPGGIIEAEKAISISNVMLVDTKSGKATRVGFSVKAGKKMRIAKKSETEIK